MMSLSETLYGSDEERAKALKSTLSNSLSGHLNTLDFKVLALGTGDSNDDNTLMETYERMRNTMTHPWKMGPDRPV